MRLELPAPVPLLLLSVVAMLPFILAPSIDTGVSGLFFDGAGWIDNRATAMLRFGLWRLSALVLLVAFILWLWALFRKAPALGGSPRAWGLIVLTYALGPGLMADGLLKRFWGRARPADTTDFGGALGFTPPWMPSDQCLSNCSFVSGEVSGATATAVALIVALGLWRDKLPKLWQTALGLVALAIPLLSALQRLSSGRHFLSDVIFAVLFTLLVASVLRLALYGSKAPVR